MPGSSPAGLTTAMLTESHASENQLAITVSPAVVSDTPAPDGQAAGSACRRPAGPGHDVAAETQPHGLVAARQREIADPVTSPR